MAIIGNRFFEIDILFKAFCIEIIATHFSFFYSLLFAIFAVTALAAFANDSVACLSIYINASTVIAAKRAFIHRQIGVTTRR
jgi:hypothetical protein